MKEALIQTSLVFNWGAERPDRMGTAPYRRSDAEHIALCLQQVQYILPSPRTSLLDVAVWIADLANALGPDQTLEEAIQQLVALHLASQLEARRRGRHSTEIEKERPRAHDGRN